MSNFQARSPKRGLSVIAADLKSFSCLTCRQRKIRCDRHSPCSNCVKATRQCSFIPPVRGKRTRTKAPKEGLQAKLRRYEKLLESYGVKATPAGYDEDSDLESVAIVSQKDVDMADNEDGTRRGRAIPVSFLEEGLSGDFERYACSHLQPQFGC